MSNLPLIPLSSDTETRPTEDMRRAIARAEVGDEQRGEDPSVTHLQERVAELLGMEEALFLPSGTMCNLVGIKVHTKPGDVVLAESMAHVIRAESAGSALASGVMFEPIPTPKGIFTATELLDGLHRLDTLAPPYGPPARLVCVEQTHNFGGGSIWPVETLEQVSALAKERGLSLHMDGARLLNACVAAKVAPQDFCAHVDSAWLDFTKGLGAPIGAVLAGSAAFIAEARRYKTLFGGAMRQAGIAAAGCNYALDHHVERLAEDHEHARCLAQGLREIEGVQVRTPHPETNIVFFDVSGLGLSNSDFSKRLLAEGVRMEVSCDEIRAVTHLDVSREGIDRALAAIRTVVTDLAAPS